MVALRTYPQRPAGHPLDWRGCRGDLPLRWPGSHIALPPKRPRMVPNPIFQVVEQVSIRLFAWSVGLRIPTTSARLTAKDNTVRASIEMNTSLNRGVSVVVGIATGATSAELSFSFTWTLPVAFSALARIILEPIVDCLRIILFRHMIQNYCPVAKSKNDRTTPRMPKYGPNDGSNKARLNE